MKHGMAMSLSVFEALEAEEERFNYISPCIGHPSVLPYLRIINLADQSTPNEGCLSYHNAPINPGLTYSFRPYPLLPDTLPYRTVPAIPL